MTISIFFVTLFVTLLAIPGSSFTIQTSPITFLSSSLKSSTEPISSPLAPDAADTLTITSAQAYSSLTKDAKTVFSSIDIANILPHRYPFALVDKIISYTPGKSAVGVKQITANEPQFTGHFPNRPIMPGVMQIEALAQLAGVICLQMPGATPGQIFFFAGVDGVKWKRPVVPGDTFVMEVEITKWNGKFGIAKAKGKGFVDGVVCVEVEEMTFALAK